MIRTLSTLLVALFLSLPASMFAQADWATVVESLRQSVVAISYQEPGACTGFVIHGPKQLVLTAAHCEGDKMAVDGEPAEVVFRDKRKDLLVVESGGAEGKPSVLVARDNAKIGQQVASFGYGHDLGTPLFRLAHVSQVDVENVAEGFASPVMAIDAPYVGGQSGGPVVNGAGEVVGIVQFGSPQVGFGLEAESIRDKVGKFLEK